MNLTCLMLIVPVCAFPHGLPSVCCVLCAERSCVNLKVKAVDLAGIHPLTSSRRVWFWLDADMGQLNLPVSLSFVSWYSQSLPLPPPPSLSLDKMLMQEKLFFPSHILSISFFPSVYLLHSIYTVFTLLQSLLFYTNSLSVFTLGHTVEENNIKTKLKKTKKITRIRKKSILTLSLKWNNFTTFLLQFGWIIPHIVCVCVCLV